MQRVVERSFQKFGNRILQGGDLYEKEEIFFNFVKSRTENYVERWLKCLNCTIISVDGMRPVKDNITFIIDKIQR